MGTGFDSARRRFALIHFVCDRRLPRGRGHRLTMHQGKWAYCGGVHTEPHHWAATGGVPFLSLIASAARKERT